MNKNALFSCGLVSSCLRGKNLLLQAVSAAGLCLAAALPAFAQEKAKDPAPKEAAPAPKYADVHAIFAKSCLGCHNSKELKGELNLENHDLLMKGGKDGPVLVPGKASESPLFRQITFRDKPFMPPPKKGDRLKPEEVAVIRAWIDAGAPGPAPGEKAAAPVIPRIEPKVPPRKGVHAVAYEPRAKLLALARPGEVELRSAETQAVVRTLSGHAGNVNDAAFSADGKVLAAAAGEPSASGEVVLWSVADGARLRALAGPADAVYAVDVSPDGATVAGGAYDGKIRLWTAATGAPLRELKGHNEAVYGLAFRPDGKVLASASADRTIKLWDVASGERLATLTEPVKGQNAVAFSPDGRRLAAAGVDSRIRVWQISPEAKEGTNRILSTTVAHEGAILRLAWSADGKTLLTAGDDSAVKLWNADDVAFRLALEAQPDWPTGLAFARDDKAVAVGRLDGSFALYAVATGKPVAAKAPPAKPMAPPKPEAASIYPRGVMRGAKATLRVTGKALAGVTEVRLHHPGLQGRLLDAGAHDDAVMVEISAAADVPPGPVGLSLKGSGGESAPLQIHVDTLPQISEVEPDDTPATATEIPPAGAAAWGVFGAGGDADCFRIDAKAGQTIVFDAAAKRIGSKAELVLAISDASGRVLAESTADGREPDPLLVFRAPADGRYVVRVSELQLAASPDHFYRLAAGELPVVTDCFPLAVAAKRESPVRLIGYNLPAGAVATVAAGEGGEAPVPVDPARFRARRPLAAMVVPAPEGEETEPNDRPEQANRIPAPARPEQGASDAALGRGGAIHGRIGAPGDADHFAFDSDAGQAWTIETMAARRGSPVDTRIEVLDAGGRPVPRVQLRAVRDSYVTFRSIDAAAPGARLAYSEEMDLRQYLYWQGEVSRLHRYPRGPDSEYAFYVVQGARRAYFDTTPVAHALDETCYIVEPHPPGAPPPANGLPTLTLNHENDDESLRRLGSDSRLHFTAPARGTYLVRVTDARGFGGERYVYRLEARASRPDFAVALEGARNPAVPPGSGVAFTVRVDPIDGFDGPVTADIAGVPPGFAVSTPLVIEAGHLEAKGVLYAFPDAAKPTDAATAAVKITATAGGAAVTKPVNGFGKIGLAAEPPKVRVFLEPWKDGDAHAPPPGPPGTTPELTAIPGTLTSAWLRIERNGFNDPVTFEVENLPHGVLVADIGLNGVLIPANEIERRIFLSCAPWVAAMDRPCFARANEAGMPASRPAMLRVLPAPAKKP